MTRAAAALAACHLFSIWHFPYPQRCPPPPVDRSWYVEITKLPPLTDDEAPRAAGIEALKKELPK